jgi:hypothetical protein
MAKAEFKIVKNTLVDGMRAFQVKHEKVSEMALGKVGLQLINWIVNGSSREGVVPPVKTGLLRGSGSVFVGNKFIGATPRFSGLGTPNQSYEGKPNEVTVGFNTRYAAKLHEEKFKLGLVSMQSGNVGNKYVEKHLKADGKALFAFYAKLLKDNT